MNALNLSVETGQVRLRMHERFKVSVQRSCGSALLQRSSWYAKSTARDQSAPRRRIRDIAMSRPRLGYLRVLVVLWARNLAPPPERQETHMKAAPKTIGFSRSHPRHRSCILMRPAARHHGGTCAASPGVSI